MDGHRDFSSSALENGLDIKFEGFEDYLRDESKFTGSALGLIRARNSRDVTTALRLANNARIPITVVSGKTSITGASAPQGGFILSLRELDAMCDAEPQRVEVGVILKQYKKFVEEKGLFYPPDPTSEDSCALGGTIACNASGSLSYLYGPTRNYIDGLEIALSNGTVLDIPRGKYFCEDGGFSIRAKDPEGNFSQDILIPAPKIPQFQWNQVKNAAGLFSQEKMDLIDLFIGGEGILGIALSARTKLIPKRDQYLALMIFVSSRSATVRLVRTLDNLRRLFHRDLGKRISGAGPETVTPEYLGMNELNRFRKICPSCMEWFGSSTSRLLEGPHSEKLARFYGALYVEQEYRDSNDMHSKLQNWSDFLEYLKSDPEFGSVETEVALDEKHLRALRLERIRVPERLNELIKPGLRKIGTDLAVSMDKLELLLKLYDEKLPKDSSYVFGHIGNSHLHANMLAGDAKEIDRLNDLHLEMARYVCLLGGSVSGEHGIGKLKKKLLVAMIGESGLNEIRRVKSTLDPNWILNRGNMVDQS